MDIGYTQALGLHDITYIEAAMRKNYRAFEGKFPEDLLKAKCVGQNRKNSAFNPFSAAKGRIDAAYNKYFIGFPPGIFDAQATAYRIMFSCHIRLSIIPTDPGCDLCISHFDGRAI